MTPSPSMPVAALADLLRGPPREMPDGWQGWDVTRAAHVILWEEAYRAAGDPPPMRGRGIVQCVSAKPGMSSGKDLTHGYLPAAWCSVSELRRHGCTLPVLWCHLGPLEWDPSLDRLASDLGVTVCDLAEHDTAQTRPMRILNGWESKVAAILAAPWEEVLFLDADCLPLGDPTYLFESTQYRHAGAIFWPDVPPYDRHEWLPAAVWANMGLPDLSALVQAVESGQLLIDRRRCWRDLAVTRAINEHSDYSYRWIFGDKDSFPLGWIRAAAYEGPDVLPRYHLVSRGAGGNHASLVHYDPSGLALFQHLTRGKPSLAGFPAPAAILARPECEAHLARLREKWSGRIWWNERTTPAEAEIVARLRGTRWTYTREGLDSRPLRLSPDRCISTGRAKLETSWNVYEDARGPLLVLSGLDGCPTCLLRPDGAGWAGRWLQYERCRVTLTPEGTPC